VKREINFNYLQSKNIIFASVAFGLVSIIFVQFLSLLTPQEVYAPAGGRGLVCEFRMNAWEQTAVGAQILPYTQGVIQQVALQAGENNPMMLIHN
jgi:hypothetical protein